METKQAITTQTVEIKKKARCYDCKGDATKLVINSHAKYRHCSWSRRYCDECWDGEPGYNSGTYTFGDNFSIEALYDEDDEEYDEDDEE